MARIGMVNYINVAPIYEVWQEQIRKPGWDVVEATPSRLNTLLSKGEIDLGFVSSHAYYEEPEKYRILAGLSISANGPVGSVFLFSRCPPEELGEKTVLLSSQSATSVNLVKILLESFWNIQPRYLDGEIFAPSGKQHSTDAVLAIGDEALRLRFSGEYPFQLDLGETWKTYTRLPFVFAVCAVREEFLREEPDTLADIHRTLLLCRDQGSQRIDEISRRAAPRIPMAVEDCLAYLLAIEYDLGAGKQQALEKFFTLLAKRNGTPHHALPLKIQPVPGL